MWFNVYCFFIPVDVPGSNVGTVLSPGSMLTPSAAGMAAPQPAAAKPAPNYSVSRKEVYKKHILRSQAELND